MKTEEGKDKTRMDEIRELRKDEKSWDEKRKKGTQECDKI